MEVNVLKSGKPNEERHWGLENIHFFGKYLAAKRFWRAISHEILWKAHHSSEIYKAKPSQAQR